MSRQVLSGTLQDKLKKLKPNKTLLVKINTGDLNQVEKDLLIFNIGYCMDQDYTGYFAIMTKKQIEHFAGYSYIKSMETHAEVDIVQ